MTRSDYCKASAIIHCLPFDKSVSHTNEALPCQLTRVHLPPFTVHKICSLPANARDWRMVPCAFREADSLLYHLSAVTQRILRRVQHAAVSHLPPWAQSLSLPLAVPMHGFNLEMIPYCNMVACSLPSSAPWPISSYAFCNQPKP